MFVNYCGLAGRKEVLVEVICSDAGAGKTDALIRMAGDGASNYYIVCSNPREVHRRALELGVNIRLPLGYVEFSHGRFCSTRIDGFLIDDVDKYVQYVAGGVKVVAISITVPEPKARASMNIL